MRKFIIFGFLCLLHHTQGQDDIQKAARNADAAARNATESAKVAAESAERAIKLAKEAAASAGIKIAELDTFETNPVPVFPLGEQITDAPQVIDQIPVKLAPVVPVSSATGQVTSIADPVQQSVSQDNFSRQEAIDSVSDKSLEFHGYFRAGYLVDLNDDAEKLSYRNTANRKESIGRIGLEVDEWWHATLIKNFETSNGKWGRATLTYGSVNSGLDAIDLIQYSGNSAKTTGLLEAYMELGVSYFPEASFWIGQRHYGRDLHSEITDFYYTDYSGTGLGLKSIPLTYGRFDFAYLTSDFTKEGWLGRFNQNEGNSIPINGGVFEADELLHAFHLGYHLSDWELGLMAKFYPANGSTVNESRGLADSGVEATVAYHQDNFYGLGEGCANYIFQFGRGLSSGPGLGANFNTHNIFRLGADPVDFINRQSDDHSYRASTYGCFYVTHGIKIMPHALVQVDKGQIDRTLVSGVLRGVYPVTDCFSLVAETGLEHLDTNDGLANDGMQYKFSIAPTYTFRKLCEAAELSLIAAHLDGDASRGFVSSETVLGLQAVLKW